MHACMWYIQYNTQCNTYNLKQENILPQRAQTTGQADEEHNGAQSEEEERRVGGEVV